MNKQPQCSELGQEGGSRSETAWRRWRDCCFCCWRLSLFTHSRDVLFSCHQAWAQRWQGAGCALGSSPACRDRRGDGDDLAAVN